MCASEEGLRWVELVPSSSGDLNKYCCTDTTPTTPMTFYSVRPTGSGLMRIGSALSGSRPDVEAVCGAQEEKRNAAEHTSSPSLETARDAAKRSESSDLSRHNDTARCSGFL
ncbi:hypothetical protein INR49_024257 [Caranx melampygus]|nr:hypothetical protein INR49_024257 [Caranx melampygus]